MTLSLASALAAPRLLFEAPLQPVMGSTFQPTGFPDLGSATFLDSGGRECVLVESAQSMANRLEETIWDEGGCNLVPEAEGLSYVRVMDGDRYLTSSVTEAHRLNSPYILEGKDKSIVGHLKDGFGVMEKGPIDRRLLAKTLFRYDVNSLLHGVFLAKKELAGGRLRLARAVSSLIEAKDVAVAASGGVKNDHVDPSGDTKKGFGNVPFSREEFTSPEIVASFCIDVQQLRAYGLGTDATELLITLALFKIRKLLDSDLRLRTRCDLEPVNPDAIEARRPAGYALPSLADLQEALPRCIAKCSGEMEVNTVQFKV